MEGNPCLEASDFPRRTTFSEVILAENTPTSYFLVGALSGTVETDPSKANYLGVDAATSGSAELSGINWALLWILQLPAIHPLTATLYYDSQYAAGCALGTYNYNAHTRAVLLAASLHQLARQYCSVRAEHV